MSTTSAADTGFWYDADPESARRRGVAVLQAMRQYRTAELAMRRRSREAMSMGENDMVLLRYLLESRSRGADSSPAALARRLGVSTASMTAMIDRLERSGHVRREQHTSDRRSILVIPTERTEHDMRHLLGDMHERMLDAVADLPPEVSLAMLETLERLSAVVDAVDPQPPVHDE